MQYIPSRKLRGNSLLVEGYGLVGRGFNPDK